MNFIPIFIKVNDVNFTIKRIFENTLDSCPVLYYNIRCIFIQSNKIKEMRG